MKERKGGFTLVEVVVALSLFTFVIIGVLIAVTRANTYVQISKLQVMAMNLAREGVEMMYTIRDTNWKKWSGERDNYRLMKDTFLTPNNDLLDSGLYYLQTRYSSGQSYPVLVKYPLGNNEDENLYENFNEYVSGNGSGFIITFTGSVSPSNNMPLEELMQTEAKFYRIVKIIGLYDKKGNNNAENPSSSPQDDSPKELRFCVKVFYVGTEYGFSELCSLMTNFKA